MLGQRIAEMRLSFGWSQVHLSQRLGVAKQTVSNWENDNIQPSIEMLVRLSHLFGVTTDYLLGLEDTPRLSLEGLTPLAIAHLSLLADDLRSLPPVRE